MAKVFINESTLIAIGNSIRAKTGSSNIILPKDMASEIENLTVNIKVNNGEGIALWTKTDANGAKTYFVDSPSNKYPTNGTQDGYTYVRVGVI